MTGSFQPSSIPATRPRTIRGTVRNVVGPALGGPGILSIEASYPGYLPKETTTVSAALTKSQTPANCVPFPTLNQYDYTQGSEYKSAQAPICYIDNSAGTAVVRFTKNYQHASYGSLDPWAQVVEFNPKVVRVQQIPFTRPDATSAYNVPIPITVNKAKTFVVGHCAPTLFNGWVHARVEYRYDLHSGGTYVTVRTQDPNGGPHTGILYVVEDISKDSSIFRVQHKSSSCTTTGNYDSSLDYSVNTGKTMLLTNVCGGYVGFDPRTRGCYPYLLDADNARLVMSQMSSANTVAWTHQIVEWLGNVEVEAGQHQYTSSGTAGTEQYNSVGTINATRLSSNTLGITTMPNDALNCALLSNVVSQQTAEMMHRVRINGGQLQHVYRKSSASVEKVVPWQILHFPYLD